MSVQEYIDRFVESKQLRLDTNGNPAGLLVPMVSVPIKQFQPRRGSFFPDIPAKLDRDGDPIVRLFPKNQVEQYKQLGWEVVKSAKAPKGLAKAEEDKPAKKGPFGRPVKEKTADHVDRNEPPHEENV